MNPTGRDLHVDQLLTNLSIGYSNANYIADRILPIVPVMKQSDIVPKYDQSHWFRDAAHLRSPGTRSRGGGFTVDKTDTYFAKRWSFRDEVLDEDRDNTDQPFNLEVDATEFVTDKLQLRREVGVAGTVFTTGVWSTDKTGGSDFTAWSDFGASTPLDDLDNYKDTVEALIGREPNKLVLGKQAWLKLKHHPDLLDLIKYTQRGQLTEDLFAALAEFANVLIGRAIYTTSPEGTAEASVTYSRIWGKAALMLYVPDRPSLRQPAAGYTFVWQRVANALQYMVRYREDQEEKDVIEGNSYFDHHVTAARAGLFMATAVA